MTPNNQQPTDVLLVTEGISGMWHYHLSDPAEPYSALCGAQVMKTSIQRNEWQKPFGEHFPKRPTWCSRCGERAAAHKGKDE